MTDDRVKARLEVERKAAEKAHHEMEARLMKARSAADDAKAKLAKTEAASQTNLRKPVSDAKAKAVREAHRDLGKALSAAVRAQNAYAAAYVEAERLASDKELAARRKAAAKFGGEVETLSSRQAAEVVLLNAGKAMHSSEITRLALETGIVRLDGATPERTMSAGLSKALKKGDTFVRVAPSIFDLTARVGVKS